MVCIDMVPKELSSQLSLNLLYSKHCPGERKVATSWKKRHVSDHLLFMVGQRFLTCRVILRLKRLCTLITGPACFIHVYPFFQLVISVWLNVNVCAWGKQPLRIDVHSLGSVTFHCQGASSLRKNIQITVLGDSHQSSSIHLHCLTDSFSH